jgi:polyisoprenoid-binding protein YceI
MDISFVRQISLGTLAAVIATAGVVAGPAQPAAVRLDSARVVVNGTSNVHAWTAVTTAAKVARVQLAEASEGASLLDALEAPDTLRAFEIVVPAASLASPKDGLDKNMHKALKVQEHADIIFRLARLEATGRDAFRATGTLTIAGVSREVALDLTTSRSESAVTVKGSIDLVMTDYGIAPPKAMLGMLKTDPKVTVQLEAVLSTARS